LRLHPNPDIERYDPLKSIVTKMKNKKDILQVKMLYNCMQVLTMDRFISTKMREQEYVKSYYNNAL